MILCGIPRKLWHTPSQKALINAVPKYILDLKENELSDIVTDILTAKYLVIGSPTLNNGILPNVATLLAYLKGLQPKYKKGFAFGSYGCGGQSIGIVNQALEDLGVEIIMEPVKINYIPSKQQLTELENKVAAL